MSRFWCMSIASREQCLRRWSEREVLDAQSVLRRLVAPEIQCVLSLVKGERGGLEILSFPEREGRLKFLGDFGDRRL